MADDKAYQAWKALLEIQDTWISIHTFKFLLSMGKSPQMSNK